MCPILPLGETGIHAYALFTWLGAAAACILALPALRHAGMSALQAWTALLLMCASFLAGARLWNLAVNPGNFLGQTKWYTLKLVGLSLYGGLIASVGLAFASKVFHVQEDEKFIAMRAELPGANCGGCGYAGCDDYAHALVEDPDGVPCTKCAVGGPACAEKLAAILGKSADGMEKQVAYVMCNGTTNNYPDL